MTLTLSYTVPLKRSIRLLFPSFLNDKPRTCCGAPVLPSFMELMGATYDDRPSVTILSGDLSTLFLLSCSNLSASADRRRRLRRVAIAKRVRWSNVVHMCYALPLTPSVVSSACHFFATLSFSFRVYRFIAIVYFLIHPYKVEALVLIP